MAASRCVAVEISTSFCLIMLLNLGCERSLICLRIFLLESNSNHCVVWQFGPRRKRKLSYRKRTKPLLAFRKQSSA